MESGKVFRNSNRKLLSINIRSQLACRNLIQQSFVAIVGFSGIIVLFHIFVKPKIFGQKTHNRYKRRDVMPQFREPKQEEYDKYRIT